jgi:hypothetical protein
MPAQSHGRSLALKRVMRLALEIASIDQKPVAIDLGIDAGTLSRYLSPDHPDTTIPAHRLKAWHVATGDLGLLRAVVEEHGMDLVAASHHAARTHAGTAGLLAQLCTRAGALEGHLAQALAHQDSDHDLAVLYPEATRLLAVVQALADRLAPAAPQPLRRGA